MKEREAVARTIFVLADAFVIAVAFTLSFFLRKEIVPTFLRPWFPQVPEASPAAGFVIERLVEPLPTETFKQADLKGYNQLMQMPAFVCIRARKDTRG